MGLETIQRKENEIGKHIPNGCNEYEDFEGKKYTDMRVGKPINITIKANGKKRR
jgi:hypothetical protein